MTTRSDVLQLLKDYRAYHTAFGGAMPLDETHVSQAAYGPGGLILTGAEFSEGDARGLQKSYRQLNKALYTLRREHFQEWGALIEPYLSDVADHSVVEDWRKKIEALDEENAEIRRQNEERAKKNRPPKPEKVALVFVRLQLERHDRALTRLTEYLEDEDLHVVSPKLMSTKEHGDMERQNAQVYALYQRLRVSGLRHRASTEQAGEMLGVPADAVERIVEFRSDLKLATCAEENCGLAVFSQNLCSKHYNREYRARNKRGPKSA